MKKLIVIAIVLFLTACNVDANDTSVEETDETEANETYETQSNNDTEETSYEEVVEEETQEDLYKDLQSVMSLEETETIQGSGGQSHVFNVMVEGMVKFTSTNEGTSNFMAHVEDGTTGERIGSVANHIGNYEGHQFLNLAEGEHILQVSSAGDWTFKIDQPYKDDFVEERTFNGSGNQTLGPFYFKNSRLEFTGEHNDEGNFMVHLLGVYGDRIDGVFNEIGNYEGNYIATIEEDAIYYLDITAGDEWSISIKE
ncbi:hypothetical protein [Oceanobacillus salinisoli]|uniref:hypothetical protein n=1 Tax=Oceanobacillus salinisoli TaxID=2678611 RepID=UPI0012E2E17C|nr:hypothetical protein [Oceanobacillus salinisoli]